MQNSGAIANMGLAAIARKPVESDTDPDEDLDSDADSKLCIKDEDVMKLLAAGLKGVEVKDLSQMNKDLKSHLDDVG